jgi:membrane-bound ClpP family serine protease
MNIEKVKNIKPYLFIICLFLISILISIYLFWKNKILFGIFIYIFIRFIWEIIIEEFGYINKIKNENFNSYVNIGKEGLIGKSAEVTYDCSPSGKVKINNEIWNATSSNNELIKTGEKVVIKDVKGLTLIVKK